MPAGRAIVIGRLRECVELRPQRVQTSAFFQLASGSAPPGMERHILGRPVVQEVSPGRIAAEPETFHKRHEVSRSETTQFSPVNGVVSTLLI